ncbi:MAG: hypothetical protein ACI8QF_004416 [Limisphaerales bacterium]
MKSNGLLDDHKNTVHLFNMKTTLEIPGAIYRRVKAHVAAQGQSVKGFVNEAVQEKLGRERAEAGVRCLARRPQIAWRKCRKGSTLSFLGSIRRIGGDSGYERDFRVV